MKPLSVIFSVTCLLFLLSFGCLESNNTITPPYSEAQFYNKNTDLNYLKVKAGDYNAGLIIFDGNKLTVVDVNNLDINFPNPDLSGYAKLDGSNMPFTGDVNVVHATTTSVPVKLDIFSTNDGTWTDGDMYAQLNFGDKDGLTTSAPKASIRAKKENTTGAQTALSFLTSPNQSPSNLLERMVIGNTGNIGIGYFATAEPATAMHFKTGGGADIRLERPSTSYRSIFQYQLGSSTEWMLGTFNIVGSEFILSRGIASPPYTANVLVANKSTGNIALPNDNQALLFGGSGDASISYDGSNFVLDPDTTGTDSGLVYIDGNISAKNFITRTSVFDKSMGSALDLVKDSSKLVDVKGEINHKEFYGYTEYTETDYSKPVVNRKSKEVCGINELSSNECKLVEYEEVTYPYKKIVSGVNIVEEIELLRQAIVELKKELCTHNTSYEWCK